MTDPTRAITAPQGARRVSGGVTTYSGYRVQPRNIAAFADDSGAQLAAQAGQAIQATLEGIVDSRMGVDIARATAESEEAMARLALQHRDDADAYYSAVDAWRQDYSARHPGYAVNSTSGAIASRRVKDGVAIEKTALDRIKEGQQYDYRLGLDALSDRAAREAREGDAEGYRQTTDELGVMTAYGLEKGLMTGEEMAGVIERQQSEAAEQIFTGAFDRALEAGGVKAALNVVSGVRQADGMTPDARDRVARAMERQVDRRVAAAERSEARAEKAVKAARAAADDESVRAALLGGVSKEALTRQLEARQISVKAYTRAVRLLPKAAESQGPEDILSARIAAGQAGAAEIQAAVDDPASGIDAAAARRLRGDLAAASEAPADDPDALILSGRAALAGLPGANEIILDLVEEGYLRPATGLARLEKWQAARRSGGRAATAEAKAQFARVEAAVAGPKGVFGAFNRKADAIRAAEAEVAWLEALDQNQTKPLADIADDVMQRFQRKSTRLPDWAEASGGKIDLAATAASIRADEAAGRITAEEALDRAAEAKRIAGAN